MDDPVRWAYWQKKYREDSAKSWNLFYKRNETRFFRDRHWLSREFPELFWPSVRRILELGCGVGNTALPLAEDKCASLMDALDIAEHSMSILRCPLHADGQCCPKRGPGPVALFACDFSEHAVRLLAADPRCAAFGVRAFVADIVAPLGGDALLCDLGGYAPGSMDAATAIFVLSAIPPEKHALAVARIATSLAPGGLLLVRDYCREDAAMVRFKTDRRLDDGLYVRQDGTLSYFFWPDELRVLFCGAGLFVAAECSTKHAETVNVKEDVCVARIFVQAKFVRTCVPL